MLNLEGNSEPLQTLVGQVEWVLSQPWFQDSLRVAFRVDGELRGFQIEFRVPKRYSSFSIDPVGPGTVWVNSLARIDILAMVSFLNGSKLTQAELVEWERHCREEDIRREKKKQAQAEQDRERKRQQLEELKRELGEE